MRATQYGAHARLLQQAVNQASGRRFSMDEQRDPVEFFSWLANQLHADLTDGKRKRRSGEQGQRGRPCISCAARTMHPGACWCVRRAPSVIAPPALLVCSSGRPHALLLLLCPVLLSSAVITDCLQGELEVTTLSGGPSPDAAAAAEAGPSTCAAAAAAGAAGGPITQRVPFLMLSLDLPPAPLFNSPLLRPHPLPAPHAALPRRRRSRAPPGPLASPPAPPPRCRRRARQR